MRKLYLTYRLDWVIALAIVLAAILLEPPFWARIALFCLLVPVLGLSAWARFAEMAKAVKTPAVPPRTKRAQPAETPEKPGEDV